MARLFDDAQVQYLQIDSAVVTSTPFTMACWFQSDSIALRQTLMWVGNKDVSNHYHALRAVGNKTGDPIDTITNAAGTYISAYSTSGYSANTWHHACGVWAASDDRRAYIDGGSRGNDATDLSPAGLNRTAIGRMADSTPVYYLSGQVAEAAIWNVALSDAEVAILAKSYSPLFVHPQNLVAYYRLIRDEDQDITGGYDLTAYNTPTIAAHPPVIYPAPPGLYAP